MHALCCLIARKMLKVHLKPKFLCIELGRVCLHSVRDFPDLGDETENILVYSCDFNWGLMGYSVLVTTVKLQKFSSLTGH